MAEEKKTTKNIQLKFDEGANKTIISLEVILNPYRWQFKSNEESYR